MRRTWEEMKEFAAKMNENPIYAANGLMVFASLEGYHVVPRDRNLHPTYHTLKSMVAVRGGG